jgi:HK97 family phage major capsid protein
MTQKELETLVGRLAGDAVATALANVHERRKDLATQVFEDRDVEEEKRRLQGRRDEKTLLLGWTAQALVKGNREKALLAMPKALAEEVEKALTSGNLEAGGAFFSPEHSQEIIDLLAPRTVVRRRVSSVIDLSAGTLDMARLTADATVTWGGEIEAIRESQPSTGNIVMRSFQEKALVPFSNTFLRRGGPRVANFVQKSTLRAMSIGEDTVFLTSPGTEYRPKGLKYWAPAATNRLVAQAFTGTDAEKLTKVTQDLGALLLVLENANVPMTGAAWAFSPAIKNYLMTARDGNGNFAFRPEMLGGLLWGLPFDHTTSIANAAYLTDYDEFMIGQGAAVQIDMSDQGTFIDADGNVISLFQRNMSALRMINEVDFVPQHEAATANLSGVNWTPAAA